MCPSEHCFQKYLEADKQSPASRQHSKTIRGPLANLDESRRACAWLSHWHEDEDGREQPPKASPSKSPRLSLGSETWGLHHSKHEGLRLRWEGGLSFLMGNVMLSMNTRPLPHSLVSVEIHSKPDLIEQTFPASPSQRGQRVVMLLSGKSGSISPHRRQPQHPWLPLAGRIPQHVLCSADSYKRDVVWSASGRARGGGEEGRKDLIRQLPGLAPDLATKRRLLRRREGGLVCVIQTSPQHSYCPLGRHNILFLQIRKNAEHMEKFRVQR